MARSSSAPSCKSPQLKHFTLPAETPVGTPAQTVIPRPAAVLAVLDLPPLGIAKLWREIWVDRKVVKVAFTLARSVNDHTDYALASVKPDVVDRYKLVNIARSSVPDVDWAGPVHAVDFDVEGVATVR